VHRFDSNRLKVWKFIRDEIGLGRNLYCLPADTGICKDGFQRFDGSVSKLSLPDYSISILHGKMKPADVKRFSDGKTNIMVATSYWRGMCS
jgi:ATP-dependent DNA helicase RecG